MNNILLYLVSLEAKLAKERDYLVKLTNEAERLDAEEKGIELLDSTIAALTSSVINIGATIELFSADKE